MKVLCKDEEPKIFWIKTLKLKRFMHYRLKIPLSPTVHLLSIGLITKQVYQNCEIHSPLVWNLVIRWGFSDPIEKMYLCYSK